MSSLMLSRVGNENTHLVQIIMAIMVQIQYELCGSTLQNLVAYFATYSTGKQFAGLRQ